MATKPKTHLGTMACLCCGQSIPVKQADNGTINAACAWCDFPAWAKAGTEAHRIILGRIKGQAVPTPASAERIAAAAPKAPPPPAPRAPASVFHLGG